MTGGDELFELRNYFYLGNLSAAWTEGETVSVEDAAAQVERDVIMARIRLARGEYDEVIGGIDDNAAAALQVIKVLATLLKDGGNADAAAAAMAGWADDAAADAPCFALAQALVYAWLGDADSCMRAAQRAGGLEGGAAAVHVMLGIDRADAAAKKVADLQRLDEDATPTQLAAAWAKLCSGGAEVQEAVYIYQDLLERHGATDAILNGQALCALARGRADDAERALQEALSKNPACTATLINAVVTARHRNRPGELVARYLEQLGKVAPATPWLVDYRAKEAEFDELAAQLEAAS